jgi:hypothetical protein
MSQNGLINGMRLPGRLAQAERYRAAGSRNRISLRIRGRKSCNGEFMEIHETRISFDEKLNMAVDSTLSPI